MESGDGSGTYKEQACHHLGTRPGPFVLKERTELLCTALAETITPHRALLRGCEGEVGLSAGLRSQWRPNRARTSCPLLGKHIGSCPAIATGVGVGRPFAAVCVVGRIEQSLCRRIQLAQRAAWLTQQYVWNTHPRPIMGWFARSTRGGAGEWFEKHDPCERGLPPLLAAMCWRHLD